ncbi:TPA: thiol peroxidase [Candidatus Delongbacteria bacterium]|nr:MAG: lipid hydroperoxide peroxidase [Candidatus Delongbacteria bacterium GWF2_40_14]HAQ62743.1 thiol peroxidase [Candidatus Delongbacteria bacterium]
MAQITLKGNPVNTVGDLPKIGEQLQDFTLTTDKLIRVHLSDYKNTRLVMNIFPSLDTPTCAMSVRQFNKLASEMKNTKVLCISRDLPFAQARFCGAEGLTNVITLSDFETGEFGYDYGVEIIDGPLKGLHSRAVIVADETGKVIYNEQVADIASEPDYDAALEALK